MTKMMGNGSSNSMIGSDDADFMAGEGRADMIQGGGGHDTMLGGGGNDKLSGDAGNDTMFGSSTLGGKVDLTKFTIAESVKGTVTFDYEEAGYKNTLGMYKIAADGTIYDTQILFANASLKGSGGNLIAGKSSVEIDLKAGDKIGFFVAPNAFAIKNMEKLFADKGGKFILVGPDGKPGNVNGGVELKLVHVDKNGKMTDVQTQYGTSIFHSATGDGNGLNGDKLHHAVGTVDVAAGTVKIGFEDLKWGGDKDYDDSMFTLSFGTSNAALLPKAATQPAKSTDHDMMSGGDGDDKMYGMAGNDTMDGGAGNDVMYGNSGDDVMSGGAGDDVIKGGKGDDVVGGGEGNDALDGGSGNDRILADAGNDTIIGGSGFDTLDFSAWANGVKVDLNAHVATGAGADSVSGIEGVIGTAFADVLIGDKGANVFAGAAGDDMFRGRGGADVFTGGEGKDIYVWYAKDIVDAKGQSLGVDTITDFGKGDVLDLDALFGGKADASSVIVKDDAKGSHVYAAIGGQMVEVVFLENFHGAGADDLIKAGMLLV
jgi:Ca2+-binding RTX toxin-like protein